MTVTTPFEEIEAELTDGAPTRVAWWLSLLEPSLEEVSERQLVPFAVARRHPDRVTNEDAVEWVNESHWGRLWGIGVWRAQLGGERVTESAFDPPHASGGARSVLLQRGALLLPRRDLEG